MSAIKVLRDNGQPMFATSGAVRGESRVLHRCDKCHRYVVWYQNKRSQKWSLVDCFRYNSDAESYWYAANSYHFRNCATWAAQDEAMTRHIDEMNALSDDAKWRDRCAAIESRVEEEIARRNALIEQQSTNKGEQQ